MKKFSYSFCVLSLFIFSSFKSNTECEYSSSNLDSAKKQIQKALEKEDINYAKYYTYKAINTLEKTKKSFESCDCEKAKIGFDESLAFLKLASKSDALSGVQTYLDNTLDLLEASLFQLDTHNAHKDKYPNDVLAMNTKNGSEVATPNSKKSLEEKIDASLEKYRQSLDKVVNTVNCKEAKAFAQGVFDECEEQLLKPNLSEGKKYYNLRTKQITLDALNKLGDCSTNAR